MSEVEIRSAAKALLDLIYDPIHEHLHTGDGDEAPEAGAAAKRLAQAIGYSAL